MVRRSRGERSTLAVLGIAAALLLTAREAGAQARPELVSFRSGELELKGFLWKPAGSGPFPAVLWNHGSEKLPVFFLQAENDYDLTPSRILADEVKAAGQPSELKFYPPFGTSQQDGHDFCVRGVATWGPDVLRFIEAHAR